MATRNILLTTKITCDFVESDDFLDEESFNSHVSLDFLRCFNVYSGGGNFCEMCVA